MIALVSVEVRFSRTTDGRVWTSTNYRHEFWQRYLDVYSEVVVLARVEDVQTVDDEVRQVDGDRVRVVAIPYYVGPQQLIAKWYQMRAVVRRTISTVDVAIVRAPSIIGSMVAREAKRNAIPIGVEVVGDPWEVFAPGVVQHPLRPVFRHGAVRGLRRICVQANAVAYVSALTLPERYPARQGAFTTSYSSIDLRPDAFVAQPREFHVDANMLKRLITIASLEQLYKGTDTLIEAVAICRDRGIHLHLTIVGDGRYRFMLERLVAERDLTHVVHFAGHVPFGDAVRSHLDNADLFVLPSRTEGLPRAMIEAMARGLPCIGSNVGGIPELLPDTALIPPDNASVLADRIQSVLENPILAHAFAQENLQRAKEYGAEQLRSRRITFYQRVLPHHLGA